MNLQTEFEFTLPRGYVDEQGNLHKRGTMRLATAIDEIAPMRDPRVQANEAYLNILLLARVITRRVGAVVLEIHRRSGAAAGEQHTVQPVDHRPQHIVGRAQRDEQRRRACLDQSLKIGIHDTQRGQPALRPGTISSNSNQG